MKKNKLILSFLLLGLGLTSVWTIAGPPKILVSNTESTYRYKIQVPVRSPYEMSRYVQWLRQQGYDIPGFNWKRQEIEVITNAAGLQKLRSTGRPGQIIEERTPGSPTVLKIDERYLTPLKVEQKLKSLAAKYPNFTRLEQIGTSLEGRAIWALLISSTPNVRSPQYYEKPSLIVDGMHHAREIMTPEVVMDYADVLLNPSLRKNKQAADLLDSWNVWIVPMLNVDGNNIVWTKDAWWRKNARGQDNRVFGVDINRNYPFKWNGCRGSSGSHGAQDYRGAAAASEPETQALMRLAQLAQPAGALSYHSFSELVLYPYGCNGLLTGDNVLHAKVATELAQLLPTDSRDGFYTPGAPWQILYAVDGDSMSFMQAAFGALSYTLEVNQEFQPKYELREPTLRKHRGAWGYFLERMDHNLLKVQVFDEQSGGRTSLQLPAEIRVSTIEHKKGERVFMTNALGYYFKVLDPGHYVISARLKDGRTGEVAVDMDGKQKEVRLVVK